MSRRLFGLKPSTREHPKSRPTRESLSSAQHRAADLLASVHMPPLPTKEEVCARASKLFARTTSLDDIVERAHRKLLDEVSRRLLKIAPYNQQAGFLRVMSPWLCYARYRTLVGVALVLAGVGLRTVIVIFFEITGGPNSL